MTKLDFVYQKETNQTTNNNNQSTEREKRKDCVLRYILNQSINSSELNAKMPDLYLQAGRRSVRRSNQPRMLYGVFAILFVSIVNIYIFHFQAFDNQAYNYILYGGDNTVYDQEDDYINLTSTQSKISQVDADDADADVDVDVDITVDADTDTNVDADMNVDSCIGNESRDWLEGIRYNNIAVNSSHPIFPPKGPLLNDDNLRMLLGQQSLCQTDCPFRALDNKGLERLSEEEMVHIWRVRLIYASLYYHQHRYAIQEGRERDAVQRKQVSRSGSGSNSCIDDMLKYNVGTFDFECKDSKFLVAEVRNTGIGSLFKWDMVNMMMSALAMNRTLVVYSNIHTNGTVFAQPWDLSSCHRRDLQCSFLPMTGCSLRIDDITKAAEVEFEVFRNFLYSRNPKEPTPYDDVRIIRYKNRAPIPVKGRTLGAINNIASSLIDELDVGDDRIPILRKAASSILQVKDTGSAFMHSDSDFVHAFIMYALRPIISKGEQLEISFQSDIPQDFESNRTLGMPIRGSDKCNQESECLQASTYFHLVGKIWLEHGLPNSTANILVTSEEEKMINATYAVAANETLLRKLPFEPRLITNTNDVRQANGNTGRFILPQGAQADDITMSILSTLKLQMNAAHTIGNCCSNFHQLIFHFLRGGCGVEHDNKGLCLQDRNESIYQLCCDKGHQPVCPRERLEQLAIQFNKTSITVEEAEMKIWEE